MSDKWTADQIPNQNGRTAVITGANSGLGQITARELARAGSQVVLACRNTDKGQSVLAEIRATIPGARAEVAALDLGDLDSVRSFAERFRSAHDGLDLLINNAGVMAPPRSETADGFELQFGTNHLGHYALTGRLLGALEGREDARVVTLSSGAHRIGHIAFDDLQWERRYKRWRAYGQSKLANLIFALELERRLRAAGSTVKSIAAHPGYAATNLQSAAAPFLDRMVMVATNAVFAQSAEIGALSQLYAATHPDLEGGIFVGPDGFAEQRGHPTQVTPQNTEAGDAAVAERLWEVSEELTGVSYEFYARAPTS